MLFLCHLSVVCPAIDLFSLISRRRRTIKLLIAYYWKLKQTGGLVTNRHPGG